METVVLQRRKELRERALGFYSAQEIHESLEEDDRWGDVPHARTVGRILKRNGALDQRRRIRRPPPPRGWYLDAVGSGRAELDRFDVIEDLAIEGYGIVDVLTGRATWGPPVGAWPMDSVSAQATIDCLTAFWRTHGIPEYAQFDNDARFQGGHNHPDVVGRVTRFCLSLNVIPVFATPREHGFQAEIENFNDLWQKKVWRRYHHESLHMLRDYSDRFVQAMIRRPAKRSDRAPNRRNFPEPWHLNLQTHPEGLVIYLRRTNEHGQVQLLGHSFIVDPMWVHRLLRCEVDLIANQIRFYRLRRREPTDQPLLNVIDYHLPHRRFLE